MQYSPSRMVLFHTMVHMSPKAQHQTLSIAAATKFNPEKCCSFTLQMVSSRHQSHDAPDGNSTRRPEDSHNTTTRQFHLLNPSISKYPPPYSSNMPDNCLIGCNYQCSGSCELNRLEVQRGFGVGAVSYENRILTEGNRTLAQGNRTLTEGNRTLIEGNRTLTEGN